MSKTYVIAEIGINHNGSVDMAKDMVKKAVEAGVDAVKFQTFCAEKLQSRQAKLNDGERVINQGSEAALDLLKKVELPRSAYAELMELCRQNHVDFVSTPFDVGSLHFLAQTCGLNCLKISSGEITNAPLLLEAGHSQKDIILSTGMCSLSDIENALAVLAVGYLYPGDPTGGRDLMHAYVTGYEVLRRKVRLLHCTSSYPAPVASVNLDAMDTMREAFGLPVGYSDHTEGIVISLAAVAKGAAIIEKHFTLDKNLPGPDHKASADFDELKRLVSGIRQIEAAKGTGIKSITESEIPVQKLARKSLFAACDIKKGDIFTKQNLTCKRPGTGISPMQYWSLLGKAAGKNYMEDECIEI